jgi:hypothetical protein
MKGIVLKNSRVVIYGTNNDNTTIEMGFFLGINTWESSIRIDNQVVIKDANLDDFEMFSDPTKKLPYPFFTGYAILMDTGEVMATSEYFYMNDKLHYILTQEKEKHKKMMNDANTTEDQRTEYLHYIAKLNDYLFIKYLPPFFQVPTPPYEDEPWISVFYNDVPKKSVLSSIFGG